MLEHEYGVKPEEVRWVLSDEDSSADLAGSRSAQEQMLPDNLEVAYGPAGKSESDLLVDDEVDALFHAAEPKAFVDGDPLVGRLFTDSRTAEHAYFAKTGIFPIMHAVAIRSDVAEANPWLPEAVFRAYATAKQQALQRLRSMGWAMISLPWLGQEAEATRELMGDNYWPYGMETNRITLTALLEYSHEQGLTDRTPSLPQLVREFDNQDRGWILCRARALRCRVRACRCMHTCDQFDSTPHQVRQTTPMSRGAVVPPVRRPPDWHRVRATLLDERSRALRGESAARYRANGTQVRN